MYIKQRMLVVMVAALVLSYTSGAAEIQFLTHNTQKEAVLDDNGILHGVEGAGLRGFLVEVVKEMMVLVEGKPYAIEDLPFARAYKMLNNEENYALFNISRSDDREPLFKWVGPTIQGEVFLFKRRGSDVNVTTLDDAKLVEKIAVQNGAGDEADLQKLGFTNLHPVETQGHALKMVAADRVQLTPVGTTVVWNLAKQFNIDPELIEQTPVKLGDTIGYIAFSKNVSDDVIQQWQTALDALKSSGKYDELIRRYLIPANEED